MAKKRGRRMSPSVVTGLAALRLLDQRQPGRRYFEQMVAALSGGRGIGFSPQQIPTFAETAIALGAERCSRACRARRRHYPCRADDRLPSGDKGGQPRYRRCFAVETCDTSRNPLPRIHFEPMFGSQILGRSLSRPGFGLGATTSSAATAPLVAYTDRQSDRSRRRWSATPRSPRWHPSAWKTMAQAAGHVVCLGRLRNGYERASILAWNAPTFDRHEHGSFCALWTPGDEVPQLPRVRPQWQAHRGGARLFLCLGGRRRTDGCRTASRRMKPRRQDHCGSLPGPCR